MSHRKASVVITNTPLLTEQDLAEFNTAVEQWSELRAIFLNTLSEDVESLKRQI